MIIIMLSDTMQARARKLIMPKNPEEVAKPSIGKVILASCRQVCIRDKKSVENPNMSRQFFSNGLKWQSIKYGTFNLYYNYTKQKLG